ncbi:MAG: NADP-dependent phosphogluconate dehydrogenase [Pseudomonadota bacterium]
MTQTAEIGLIGLGTMGANLALNIASNGHRIAVFNRTTSRTKDFVQDAGDLSDHLIPTETLDAFSNALAKPRRIILMVPAGKAVDDQIDALRPLLDAGDIIVDAGNSDWQDTGRRERDLGDIHFLGLGVSGGAEGARHGPSMMAGGTAEAYGALEPVLTDIAADFEGSPCVAHLGPEGAGHYVKMVHNGIEYADMQMIAEVYGLMQDGRAMSANDIGSRFARWNEGPLRSYLIEITAEVARAIDPESGAPMLDVILDKAGQKGTGRWTVVDAQTRAAPLPAVEAAVTARILSGERDLRVRGAEIFGGETAPLNATDSDLESALLAGKILAYSQGFHLLATASAEEDWSLPLPRIAEIWRAGCIIRSALLDDMARALTRTPDAPLAHAPDFAALLKTHIPGLRRVVAAAFTAGLPVPALAASLSYFDTLRQARGTANMIQGQRDFFGAHGFERLDRPGETGLHGPWGA